MVFVDFEHWYISLDNMYHKRPDIKAFRDELTERYDIADIAFFGDFSNPSLRAEISSIRAVSNTIIDTQNTSSGFTKDFTDFIMLDHIYQSALNNHDLGAYVIFTGDGHFSSAVSFLVTKCRKEVMVYAVREACSKQLRDSANHCRLIPDNEVADISTAKRILRSLSAVYDKKKQKKKKPCPTFWATVEAVSRNEKIPRNEVADALRTLVAGGYVYQVKEKIGSDTVKVLRVNWQKANEDNLL